MSKIKGLPDAQERERIVRVLNEIESLSKEIFTTRSNPLVKCLSMEKRPASIILKISVLDGEQQRFYFVKMPLSPAESDLADFRREYLALRFIYSKFIEKNILGVVKPICHLRTDAAFITEEEGGSPLSDYLHASCYAMHTPEAEKIAVELTMRKCGEWLRHFQSIWPIPEDVDCSAGSPYRKLETIGFIDSQLESCQRQGLLDKCDVDLVTSYIRERSASVDEKAVQISGMHSDFITANIYLVGDGVRVLDFGRFKTGPACRDVANLLYSLDRMLVHPFVRRNRIAAMKEAFLEGYGWGPDIRNLALFNIFQIREILGGVLEYCRRNDKSLKGMLRLVGLKRLTSRLLHDVVASSRSS